MNPIKNRVGTIFIPVRNIEKSRDWYCDIFGFPVDGEILFGHLYVLPMEGTSIVLDSKIYSKENVFKTPAFHLDTENIHDSYDYLVKKNVELVTGIEHDHWFNFMDPDGNHIMVCKC